KIIGDTKPFGYRFDHKSSNYIIIEKEAEIVRHIYSWLVTERIGTPGIAKRLNEKGFVSPRTKKPWTPNTIYYLIKQPRYMGTHIALTTKTVSTGINSKKVVKRPESEWIEVQVPAIVDELTWYTAQKQLRMNKMKSSRNQKKDHVLAGLVFCAKCGRKMKIEYSGRKPYPGYYVCNGVVNPNFRYAGGSRCDTRRIPCEVLESIVMDILENISINPSEFEQYIFRPSNEINIEEKKNDLVRLKQREDCLQTQRKTILRWFQQKIIEEKDAEQQLNSLKRQQDGILDYKKSIIKEINDSPTPPEYTSNDIMEIVQNYFKDTPLTFEKQRELALTVISKVTAIRIDATTGHSSVPEIDVHLTFVGV
ncbi:MAG: recombinase family protein, partial [Veillonellales bacterium]